MEVNWTLVGPITGEETIATGSGIRELKRLRNRYGGRTWRKRKGFGRVRFLSSGRMAEAELHWYEAQGVGKVELKLKTLL